jgi:hypothetical protein
MFSNKEKMALTIVGLEIVGCFALMIYCYGKAKYYEGRISKYNELKPLIDGQQNLVEDLMKKREAE